MNTTRRGFVTICAALVLAACSSGGESATTAAPESKWHTILFEGLSMEVPKSVEIDEEAGNKLGGTRDYWAKDDDTTINAVISDDELILTGNYDVHEVNGIKVYVDMDDEETCYIKLNHGGKGYSMMVFMNQKTGDRSKYEEARDHIIESLSF